MFTSSITVYDTNQLPMTMDPYGISKHGVEMIRHASYHQIGLNSIVFGPHNVYGEHQNLGDKYYNVIGIFMKDCGPYAKQRA